jgi:restriction system protein
LFNVLIQTSGEHRTELIALRQDIQGVERRPCNHHARLRRLESPREDRLLEAWSAGEALSVLQ